ncbi:MAG TPA: hypothetical protein VFK43_17035, partial [Acidimicrobiales bacterium]|nr:hypothetical protein [Acidimicrobiales bacterium]
MEIFFDSVNADISDDKIELPGQDTKRNGDKCENGEGVIRTKVWDTRDPSDPGRIVEGDPSNLRPQDNQLITIAFGPQNEDIPKPPSEKNLDALTDVPGATTTTSVPPSTTSTSTSTTTAPSTTTTSTP